MKDVILDFVLSIVLGEEPSSPFLCVATAWCMVLYGVTVMILLLNWFNWVLHL